MIHDASPKQTKKSMKHRKGEYRIFKNNDQKYKYRDEIDYRP